ncbi:Flp pilus assembly protein TadG [Pseudoduganella lurida]|uniref:Flp pilus assembly protein TadG n=2 Tax=Pseudoduganella lurida TaxID=1036180 RepID=A0A562RE78_9BURK|nr:Flp pilus assembly protein TadG [Pseudoduganella lurida]
MVAVSMLVLIAAVGLVVDGGLAYMVKARLNAAVDSAALAAARAVPAGNNQAEQIASAQAAAAQFFAANISDGYLLSKPKLLSTSVVFDGGTAIIDVKAEAPMPVSLMRVLGFTSMTPAAAAQTIRKDLDMAFVVDTSSSLRSAGTGVKTAAKSFLNKFNVTQDRVSLIHFATGAEIDNAFKGTSRGFDRASMLRNIDGLSFDGPTASPEGMWNAREQLNGIPLVNRSSLRVIVFFSDGLPNTFASYLTFKNGACNTAGSFNYVEGLFRLDDSARNSVTDPNCAIRNYLADYVSALPDWYNGHAASAKDTSRREFRVAGGTPRTVTSSLTRSNGTTLVTRAARNLAEAIAQKAREEGIFVFTLGMGSELRDTDDVDGEIGENILKCMANTPDSLSRCYKPAQPVGMYCYAATEADLTPCFSRLASAILRISK